MATALAETMPPRLFVEAPLAAGRVFELSAAAARHVQVLRLQPGDAVTLFDGSGGQWRASVEAMTRRGVLARSLEHEAIERELPLAVALALSMPAGERMDGVVEKATELGAAALQPLLSQRSVLRLSGERADKRRAHWQAIARAACEQCGRNRVPPVHAPTDLAAWLLSLGSAPPGQLRWQLGWHDALAWHEAAPQTEASTSLIVLSGPEGGLSDDEQALAAGCGFVMIGLGARVLRADTAPLAVMASLSLQHGDG
jgi:16S rRNA (uracil1498-N3)-methyltransferase